MGMLKDREKLEKLRWTIKGEKETDGMKRKSKKEKKKDSERNKK